MGGVIYNNKTSLISLFGDFLLCFPSDHKLSVSCSSVKMIKATFQNGVNVILVVKLTQTHGVEQPYESDLVGML